MTRSRIATLTAATLLAFAANSLLTRGALAGGRLDAATFLALRMISGAVMLSALAWKRQAPAHDPANHWQSTLALTGYAVAFTFAYLRIGAGIGALTLFGGVQTTMIAAGLRAGERPGRLEVAGLVVALAGLVILTVPGAARPSLWGVGLMVSAGVCWGVYSLRGRRSREPLVGTAHNFARAVPVVLLIALWQWPARHYTTAGVLLAIVSGALTSGVGYALWYTVLPHLTTWRAALVQLLTPVLTAVAAVVMLGEAMSVRLLVSGTVIIAGVLLSMAGRRRS